jgi:membrane fusion protein, macrolide-specific efflux system
VAVAAVIAAGLSWWLAQPGDTGAAATPAYRSVAASVSTIRQSISASGTIAPAREESLDFGVSGTVTAVKVAEGDAVRAGQVLATVDSASAKATLAQAKAQLADTQAKLANDTSSGAGSTQLDADRASVTAAQGQVGSAQNSLSAASLTSPIDGVVASVSLSVAQQVSGSGSGSGSGARSGSGGGAGSGIASGSTSPSSSGSSGAQILVISDKSWIVNTTVDDTEIGLLAKGDQAQIGAGSATTPVYGTISSVGLIASSADGVANFPVVVTVTGSPSGLHAGATATVSLIYKQLTNVLTVPTAAVRSTNGTPYVLRSKNGKQISTSVTTGLSSGGLTQITRGLSEGEQVLVPEVRAGGRSGSTRTGSTTGRFPGGGFGGGGGLGGGFGGGGGVGGN